MEKKDDIIFFRYTSEFEGIWAFQLLTNKLFEVTAKLFETVA